MKALILSALLTAAASAQTIQPAGIQIVWEDLKKEFDGFSTLNTDSGTKLALYLKSEKSIIGFERDSVQVESLTDDKGTNLKGEIDFFAKVSEDAKIARFTIKADKFPIKGATALKAKGTVTLSTASTKKSLEIKNAELKKGTKLQANPDFAFTIEKAQKPSWGNKPWEISFKFKFKPEQLANITFKDDKGNIIPSKKNGSSSMTAFGNSSYTYNYALDKKIDNATITLELWTDRETKKIPFDLTVPLGQP